jgi:hypothetical protein
MSVQRMAVAVEVGQQRRMGVRSCSTTLSASPDKVLRIATTDTVSAVW